jgi:hypothetical protein
MVQFCSLTMPEAQKIPASQSLMNTSSRGPTVFAAIRVASRPHPPSLRQGERLSKFQT